MNARGIALAADSAVTLGDGQKIYLNAEKLFELAPTVPIGIMTYGAEDLTGVPCETIIAGYRKYLGDRRHDTLAEYLDDFVTSSKGPRPCSRRWHSRNILQILHATSGLRCTAVPGRNDLASTAGATAVIRSLCCET